MRNSPIFQVSLLAFTSFTMYITQSSLMELIFENIKKDYKDNILSFGYYGPVLILVNYFITLISMAKIFF